MPASKKPKVVIIGIDGGTWDLLLPWAEDGKIPVIKKLLKEGSFGNLKSTFPPRTSPAWFSLSTGKNPGKLGVFGFYEMRKGAYEVNVVTNEVMFNQKEVWDLLGAEGLRSLIFNYPVAYPPKKIKGMMVAGILAPGKEANFTYPPSLKKKLDEITGGYEISYPMGGDDKTVEKKYLSILEKRKKVLAYFLKKRNYDLFLGVFSSTDWMSHRFLNRGQEGKKTLQEFFIVLDGHIGELLSYLKEEDFLLLISDHGFGKIRKGFYTNQWLINEGYLTLNYEKEKIPLWRRLRLSKAAFGKLLDAVGLKMFVLTKFAKIVGKIPEDQKFGEGSLIIDLIREGKIDWSKTKAICPDSGAIVINTNDRPEGTVELGQEFEKVQEEIKKKLKRLGKKEGIKIRIFKPEEIYWGKHVSKAPALLFEIDEGAIEPLGSVPYSNKVFENYQFAGHRENGIFLIKGPGIKQGCKIREAEIYDVAPTILSLFRIASLKDMDGRVLKEVFG